MLHSYPVPINQGLKKNMRYTDHTWLKGHPLDSKQTVISWETTWQNKSRKSNTVKRTCYEQITKGFPQEPILSYGSRTSNPLQLGCSRHEYFLIFMNWCWVFNHISSSWHRWRVFNPCVEHARRKQGTDKKIFPLQGDYLLKKTFQCPLEKVCWSASKSVYLKEKKKILPYKW